MTSPPLFDLRSSEPGDSRAAPNDGVSAAAPALSVDGLTCRHGTLTAVDEITFQVDNGEVVGLLGPNGAGKSTTMNAICGIVAPVSGSVHVAGHDLHEAPLAAKRRIGYLPEHPPLYQELTVNEYLSFCARLRRVPRTERSGALDYALESCGLGSVRHRLIAGLSKGFQQRVGIAQAIIHTPSVVVLDEPTVGLDPHQIREIRQLIRRLGQDRAVVLSTHLLPEVSEVCDRVLILNKGQIVLSAPLTDFAASPEEMGGSVPGSIPDRAPHLETIMELSFTTSPDVATLARLPGIERARRLGARFRVECSDRTEAIEGILAASLAEGWGLLELRPGQSTLEAQFIALTYTDRTAPAPIGPGSSAVEGSNSDARSGPGS